MQNETTKPSTIVYYGATYSTESHNFGEIINIFEVDADWDGYRFHGYYRPTAEEVAAYYGN